MKRPWKALKFLGLLVQEPCTSLRIHIVALLPVDSASNKCAHLYYSWMIQLTPNCKRLQIMVVCNRWSSSTNTMFLVLHLLHDSTRMLPAAVFEENLHQYASARFWLLNPTDVSPRSQKPWGSASANARVHSPHLHVPHKFVYNQKLFWLVIGVCLHCCWLGNARYLAQLTGPDACRSAGGDLNGKLDLS